MSKIEVGEYVRTDNGEIHKVLDTEKGSIKIKSQYKEWIGLCCIKKHSNQLIDLIEQRDIVEDEYGKYEVAFISGNRIYCNDYNYDDSVVILKEKDIETILTKEIYMAKCYKVGGKDE